MRNLEQAKAGLTRLLWPLGVFSLVANLLLLTTPLYMLQIYDRVLTSQSMDTLVFLSIIAGGALVVLGLMEIVRPILASRAAARLETTLGADALLASMVQGRATQGDTQVLRDLGQVRQFLASRAIFALIDLPFAPLFIAILWFIHPALFVLTIAGAAILFLLAIVNQMIVAKPSKTAQDKSMLAHGQATALARNAESLRAMGMVEAGVTRWGAAQADALNANGVVDGRNAVLSGISRTIRMGLQVAILGYGAYLVLQGDMTAGMIFASSIISGRALQPIDQVIGGWRQYVASWAAWKRVRDRLGAIDFDREYTPMPEPKGLLTAENVSVPTPGGRPDQPILDRISMRLEPGQTLGLVGPSGSGKSTFARALVGAVAPPIGAVRLDGTDLRNWDPLAVGRFMGYVAQEVELLPGTIAQNIARLDPEPDPQKLQRAAERAQVTELIKQLPQGFDTLVGPGGMGLSGGERQRIALARAFYGDPRILVLDEPNAALDERGEAAFYKAVMDARRAGTTIVVVSQRAMPKKLVDMVMRIANGRVDFFGPVDEYEKRLREAAKNAKGGAVAPHPVPPGKALPGVRPQKPVGGDGPATPAATSSAPPATFPVAPGSQRKGRAAQRLEERRRKREGSTVGAEGSRGGAERVDPKRENTPDGTTVTQDR